MKTSFEQLQKKVAAFMHERDWEQFHSPKNMSCAISVEAAELLEIFRWSNEQESYALVKDKRMAVEHEVADILILLIECARVCDINLIAAVEAKLAELEKKYPVERSKGNCKKYTEL